MTTPAAMLAHDQVIVGTHRMRHRVNDQIRCRGRPALMLFDFDSKGMPAEVKAELRRFGGFWPALLSAIPGLKGAGRVARRSTSAGLYRTDTGVQLPGSGGEHDFIGKRLSRAG